MLFGRKKQKPQSTYDRERLRPVIRVSICTGEEVAGFRDLSTGKFREVQLLRSREDLQDFMETYGIAEIPQREY